MTQDTETEKGEINKNKIKGYPQVQKQEDQNGKTEPSIPRCIIQAT